METFNYVTEKWKCLLLETNTYLLQKTQMTKQRKYCDRLLKGVCLLEGRQSKDLAKVGAYTVFYIQLVTEWHILKI